MSQKEQVLTWTQDLGRLCLLGSNSPAPQAGKRAQERKQLPQGLEPGGLWTPGLELQVKQTNQTEVPGPRGGQGSD